MTFAAPHVAVYCGARPGASPAFLAAAARLGEALAARGLALVYGGGGSGMMGALADAALAGGGAVVGVRTPALVELESAHPGLALPGAACDDRTRLEIVPDMHTRKARMFDLADAVVVLPGGLGTLDEIVEVLTWGQLGMHTKPCGMINVDGFFGGLLQFLDDAVRAEFLSASGRDALRVERDADALLDALQAHGNLGAGSAARAEA